jgi:two-component system, sensor histidine kinase
VSDEPTDGLLLVVDDDEANRYAIGRMMRRVGFEVLEAASGEEGLRLAASGPELILLDVRLPDISGFEVCRRLKTDPRTSSIPVLQMSASYTSSADQIRGLEHADAYLAQPIDTGVLVATVRALIRARRAERQAQRAIRERNDLVAVVSHDLRDPLSTIGIGASLLLEAPPSGPGYAALVRRQAESIHRSVQRMTTIIQELLLAEKLESGQVILHHEELRLGQLVGEVFDLLCSLAKQKSLSFDTRVEHEESVLSCDRSRLLQVLSNLVGNAIKFTPEAGRIELRAAADEHEALFEVSDSGPGIPAGDRERIFDRFWQARETAREGTGLGLFIAKGIVEAHGGRIWVESEPGAGSTFRFTIPLGQPAARA